MQLLSHTRIYQSSVRPATAFLLSRFLQSPSSAHTNALQHSVISPSTLTPLDGVNRSAAAAPSSATAWQATNSCSFLRSDSKLGTCCGIILSIIHVPYCPPSFPPCRFEPTVDPALTDVNVRQYCWGDNSCVKNLLALVDHPRRSTPVATGSFSCCFVLAHHRIRVDHCHDESTHALVHSVLLTPRQTSRTAWWHPSVSR